ncbi:hypothetical protein [Gordonia sp. ABSL49_1]|nr:hypothetical protein [Gordonia sp. ABSL49_1]MCH5644146.1 hypothetical protein [Gordonia sp. ABSL49_1]
MHHTPYERRRAIAGGALLVFTVLAFYAVPIAVMALCIDLGWCAEVPA